MKKQNWFWIFFSVPLDAPDIIDRTQMRTYDADYNHCGTIFTLRPHFNLNIVDHSTGKFGTHITTMPSFERTRKLVKIYRLPTITAPKDFLTDSIKYENRKPYGNMQAFGAGLAKVFNLNRNPFSKETVEHCSMAAARDVLRHLRGSNFWFEPLESKVSMIAPNDIDIWLNTYFEPHYFKNYQPGDFEKLRGSFLDSF